MSGEISCPRCGSSDVTCSENPHNHVCHACGYSMLPVTSGPDEAAEELREEARMSEPKQYEVPEGHLIQLGADVLDGWEGRWSPNRGWVSAGKLRSTFPNSIVVTRRIPERMVTVELPESVATYIAGDRWVVSQMTEAGKRCRKALEADR